MRRSRGSDYPGEPGASATGGLHESERSLEVVRTPVADAPGSPERKRDARRPPQTRNPAALLFALSDRRGIDGSLVAVGERGEAGGRAAGAEEAAFPCEGEER